MTAPTPKPPKAPGVLDEPGGKPSTVRRLSWAALVVAAVLSLGSAFTDADVPAEVTWAWLLAAFGPKVAQRYAEQKAPNG